jgi:hypothetical protein
MGSDAVLHKDIVLALLGASATLVGLILVFVGLVVSAVGSFTGDTAPAVKAPLRRTAVLTLVPFGLGLIQILAGAFWLLKQWCWLYDLTFWLFIATVGALAGAAIWTIRELVWD